MARKFNNFEEAVEYVQTLPMVQIVNLAASSLYAKEAVCSQVKISVTEEQLNAINSLFKLKTTPLDPETGLPKVERRGRPRKNKE